MQLTTEDIHNKRPAVMSTTTASKIIDIGEHTLRAWCKNGKIPATKIGYAWKISTKVIEEILTNGLDLQKGIKNDN